MNAAGTIQAADAWNWLEGVPSISRAPSEQLVAGGLGAGGRREGALGEKRLQLVRLGGADARRARKLQKPDHSIEGPLPVQEGARVGRGSNVPSARVAPGGKERGAARTQGAVDVGEQSTRCLKGLRGGAQRGRGWGKLGGRAGGGGRRAADGGGREGPPEGCSRVAA